MPVFAFKEPFVSFAKSYPLKIVLSAIALLIHTIAAAQVDFLEGKIVDAETGFPLSYANVFIPSTKEGMFANDEGLFKVKTEGLKDEDSIWFSHLGYEHTRTTIGVFKSNGNTAHVKPTQYNLSEVVITPLDAKTMLQNAVKNAKENYPSDYSKTRMMFKDFSKRSGHRSHYFYFDLDAYIQTYQGKKLNVFSKVYKHEMYDKKGEFAVSMKPTDILQIAMVENTFREEKLKDFEFTYLGKTTYEGAELDVIAFKSIPTKKNNFVSVKGRTFITKGEKAIQYVEFNIKSERSKRFMLVAKMDTLNVLVKIAFRPVENQFVIDYAVQTTYAKSTLFGKQESLVYSTTVKAFSHQLHLQPSEIYSRKEVEEIIKKEKPKDISLLKEDPDMQLQ